MANEFITADMRTFMQLMARRATEGLSAAESVAITYTHVPSRTLSSTTMQITEGANVTGSYTAHKIDLAGSPGREGEQAGMVAFVIEKRRMDDDSISEPTERDRITEGSDTYLVKSWNTEGAELRWYLACQKVKT